MRKKKRLIQGTDTCLLLICLCESCDALDLIPHTDCVPTIMIRASIMSIWNARLGYQHVSLVSLVVPFHYGLDYQKQKNIWIHIECTAFCLPNYMYDDNLYVYFINDHKLCISVYWFVMSNIVSRFYYYRLHNI